MGSNILLSVYVELVLLLSKISQKSSATDTGVKMQNKPKITDINVFFVFTGIFDFSVFARHYYQYLGSKLRNGLLSEFF